MGAAIQSALPAIISGVTLVLLGAFGRSLSAKFSRFEDRFDALSSSQKNQIKKDITDTYHTAMQRGYILDNELETALGQFEDYKRLGGNSYVASRVEQMKGMKSREEIGGIGNE